VENRNVEVAGSGMTGLETAEILNETGNRVTILEMADEIAPGTWFQLLDDEMERLRPAGTAFRTELQLIEIGEGEVVCADLHTGHIVHIPADSVVLSLGVRPENGLKKTLEGAFPVYTVGDAAESGTIAHAVHSAYEICKTIR
jgi:pyruvate/2-oxoglutarate dehydrogenase complex dihydrolipoamide dehydrogenase (E3) component